MNDQIPNPIVGVSSQRTIVIAQFALFVFALILRIYRLDYESLWMDELYQVSFYPHSFGEIIHLAAGQQQPPLDYWIGHMVMMFSQSDFAVRLPSALFGTGSVLMVAVLAGKAGSWQAGIGCGVIAALLPFNMHYSREARPYAIAVFFFLAVLWALVRLLESKDKIVLQSAVLFLFAVSFLHTRTLSPMVVVTVFVILLVVWLIKAHVSGNPRNRIVAALTVFSLSLILWIPGLSLILSKSGQYVSDASFGFRTILAGIARFDIAPAWKAFVTQTDPLAFPLLTLVGIAPFVIGKNMIPRIAMHLLPGALLLNLFVFQAKTTNSFKPAYAIYLLPLTLILSATAFDGLWQMAKNFKFSRTARSFLALTGAALIVVAGISAADFQGKREKHDWRETARFLSKNFSPRHVLIFDAFKPHGQWEPAFFGFPRYYSGPSKLVTMAQIPEAVKRGVDPSLQPVAVLYMKRRYSPPASLFLPERWDYERFGGKNDGELAVDEFTGFAVVRLKETQNDFSKDTYHLIEKILMYFPEDSTVVELRLAAAALASDPGDREIHLEKARKLASDGKKDDL